ncbi:MAG TPA: 23S rRNA (adenine(2503)-C(2))-methyltransferase RlmN [Nitrospirae bacterium]|nr:23S rRNA (adenine(2503)-C(2))-methyltransferase RlmN [Nitrospirota bacterium]
MYSMKTNLRSLSKTELIQFIEQMGQKPYRAKQIINWLYKRLANSFDEMTDLSKEFRADLEKKAYISNLTLLQKQVSRDGTEKFLFGLEDGESIESVVIPNTKGEASYSLCISSQVGCAMKCLFCRTGGLGLKRNLRSYEIVNQVISSKRLIGKGEITNIVFMGMGEPFNNFKEVRDALMKITELIGYSKRKITVSTSGIVPGIKKFGDEGPDVNLAISLNASTDESRTMIMPINKKYPLENLMKACREFPLAPRRRITFEYVLIGDINDSSEDARRVTSLLKDIRAKVNLIPFNPVGSSTGLKKSSEGRVLKFQDIINKAGITTMIRKSKGSDISAACGQLKAGYK